VQRELEESQRRAGDVRARLLEARAALEAIETRERDLVRRGAQLEGDAEAADAQAAELGRRLERLSLELDTASEALSDLETQGDLFSGRAQALTSQVEKAHAAVREGEQILVGTRAALEEARAAEMTATELASSLAARRAALEAMDRDQEGLEPAVRAALDLGISGVHGVLADFLEAPAEWTKAVEGYLGPLARGLVVRDASVAGRLLEWFDGEWQGGGGLVLLPLDGVPPGGDGPTLPVRPVGEGAPWVRALLAGVEPMGERTLLDEAALGSVRLAPSGASRDTLGVVRVGNPSGATGILERRERLRSLVSEAEGAAAAAGAARERREEAQTRVRDAEDALDRARARAREAEDTERLARAEVAEQVDRKSRMDRHRDELSRQAEGTRAARARAEERARAARQDRAELEAQEDALRDQRLAARGMLEAVQEEWESARAEESTLTVHLTRLEGEVGRLRERLDAAREGARGARQRVDALHQEEERLQEELEGARGVRAEGEEATRALFARREDAEEALAERHAAWEALLERLREAERRARQARLAEREAADHRHRLELERQETQGRIDRIQERLEGEWGRSLENLLADAEPVEEELGQDVLQEELKEIVVQLERIGPVNMLAVEEHEEESRRLSYLKEQHHDLVTARDDLRSAIRQINQTATELFLTTFGKIRENFRSVHQRLFEGGEADIWLGEDEDPLEAPVEIHASPRGKKTQRIDLLSGGERALTALSLLFAIYLVKPSPFCVLDEVDAPLDENNIGRFIRLLEEFKGETQFVVITHNPRTIESADWIYGVTMEEPGVSTIVGVRLEDALEQARGTAA